MKLSERMFANLFIQAATLLFLTVYSVLTYSAYPGNWVWCVIAVVIGLTAHFRQLPGSLLASLLFSALYGGFTLYKLFIGSSMSEVGWNEVLWIFAFPYAAIVGGLNTEERWPRLKQPEQTDSSLEEKEEPMLRPVVLDESLGFKTAGGQELLDELEALAGRGTEERFTFSLLLIEIEGLARFEREYGHEQSLHLLRRTAGMIHDVLPAARYKAYLQQGLFAVILMGTDEVKASQGRLRLEHKFETMLLSRSRKDGYVRIALRFGGAEFPVHGLAGHRLMDRAVQELHAERKEAQG